METALSRRVRKLGYLLDRTLMDNPRKGQITALMTAPDGRRVVVKWVVNPGTGAACGLSKEIRFYRSAGRSHCAAPIHVEDDLLVLAYVDSVPLRRWLRTYLDAHPDDLVAPDFAAVMDRYGDLLEEWYGHVPFVFSADTRTSLAAMMNRLMNSGPSDARGGVLERVANRLLSWPARLMLALQTRRWSVTESENAVPVHGDLHLNNLLVAKADSRMLAVDWETVQDGSPLLDLLYSSAMIRALLDGRPRHLACLDEAVSRLADRWTPDQKRLFYFYSESFALAVSINRRFLHRVSGRTIVGRMMLFPWRFARRRISPC